MRIFLWIYGHAWEYLLPAQPISPEKAFDPLVAQTVLTGAKLFIPRKKLATAWHFLDGFFSVVLQKPI